MATLDNDQDNDDQESFENDDSEKEEDDPYSHLIQSIRSDTGLEIAVQVTWPNLPEPPLVLSTCLPEDSIAPIFHGTQWAGTRVWQASVVALEYLLSLTVDHDSGVLIEQHNHDALTSSSTRPLINSDTRLLELGAGLAVPSLLLKALRDASVVITDIGSLVSQLQANIAANRTLLLRGRTKDDEDEPADTSSSNKSSSIQACALDWSRKGVHDLLEQLSSSKGGSGSNNESLHLDVILNCDCLFEPLYGPSDNLVECQEALLEAFPNCFMLTVCERRNQDGIEKYMQALADSSIVRRVEQIRPTTFQYPCEVELYRLYGV